MSPVCGVAGVRVLVCAMLQCVRYFCHWLVTGHHSYRAWGHSNSGLHFPHLRYALSNVGISSKVVFSPSPSLPPSPSPSLCQLWCRHRDVSSFVRRAFFPAWSHADVAEYLLCRHELPPWKTFITGCISASLGQMLGYPFDLVRRRIQAQVYLFHNPC